MASSSLRRDSSTQPGYSHAHAYRLFRHRSRARCRRRGAGARRLRRRHGAGPERRRHRRSRSRDGGVPPRRAHPRHGVGHRAGRPAGAREGRRHPGHRGEASGHAGDAVPDRLDDQGLHGAVDPEAARRRQAVAGRAGRDLRARAARLEVPDRRRAEDPRARPADAHRRLRDRRPVGRSADADARGGVHAPAEGGRAVHARARPGDGVLEPRLRAARPHRRQRLGPGLQGFRARPDLHAARDGVDRLRRRGLAGGASRARLPLGRRRLEARADDGARRVRGDGRHPDQRDGLREVGRVPVVRLAGARRRGRRAGAAIQRPRAGDRRQLPGAARARRRHRRHGLPAGLDLRDGPHRRRRLRSRPDAEPRRRLPRLRLARAAAARLRRRHLRLRQPHLRRPASAGVGRRDGAAPRRPADAATGAGRRRR